MNYKPDEQIVSEIEVHINNAVKLLKKSHEIKILDVDLENLDEDITEMRRAVEFQKFSMDEIQRAVTLQNILLQRRLESIERLESNFVT